MRFLTGHKLRCFCSGHPILAVYGILDTGEPYVHIKTYRKNELKSEVVFTSGKVRIHCPRCLVWHKIVITGRTRAQLIEDREVAAAMAAVS